MHLSHSNAKGILLRPYEMLQSLNWIQQNAARSRNARLEQKFQPSNPNLNSTRNRTLNPNLNVTLTLSHSVFQNDEWSERKTHLHLKIHFK